MVSSKRLTWLRVASILPLLMIYCGTGADVVEIQGGNEVLNNCRTQYERLKHLFVDGGYRGKWIKWVKESTGLKAEVVQRPDANLRGLYWPANKPVPEELMEKLKSKKRGYRKFLSLPERQVVERTFSQFCCQRRLSKDYEYLLESSEAFIYIAMIRIMTRKLAPD